MKDNKDKLNKHLPKTLVIGARGFIGSNMLKAYRKYEPDCMGTSYIKSDNDLCYLNLLDPKLDQVFLENRNYKAAIIATGITGVEKCENHPALSWKVNVEGTTSLIHQLYDRQILPIIFASPSVFGAMTLNGYIEGRPYAPLGEYGRQKAHIEQVLHKLNKPYLMLRLGKVFDIQAHSNTFISNIAEQLLQGQQVHAAYDEIICPLWVKDVVRAVLEVQRHDFRGTINICPPEAISRYNLALAVAETLDCPKKLVNKISLNDLPIGARMVRNNRLNPYQLINDASFKFTPLEKSLELLKEQYQVAKV